MKKPVGKFGPIPSALAAKSITPPMAANSVIRPRTPRKPMARPMAMNNSAPLNNPNSMQNSAPMNNSAPMPMGGPQGQPGSPNGY